jgi:hypothetical protein
MMCHQARIQREIFMNHIDGLIRDTDEICVHGVYTFQRISEILIVRNKISTYALPLNRLNLDENINIELSRHKRSSETLRLEIVVHPRLKYRSLIVLFRSDVPNAE